jgi:DinB superfamily
VSARGTELMTRASRQLDQIAELVDTLDDADLRRPYPDDAGDTVGEAAAHVAEGYHLLGRFLQAAGYAPGAPAGGDGRGHVRHGRAPAPAAVAEVRDRLGAGRAPIGLLAHLTDEQLDSVPRAANRFADGRRTLEEVVREVIAHQAARLDGLREAVR